MQVLFVSKLCTYLRSCLSALLRRMSYRRSLFEIADTYRRSLGILPPAALWCRYSCRGHLNQGMDADSVIEILHINCQMSHDCPMHLLFWIPSFWM